MTISARFTYKIVTCRKRPIAEYEYRCHRIDDFLMSARGPTCGTLESGSNLQGPGEAGRESKEKKHEGMLFQNFRTCGRGGRLLKKI